MQNCIAGLTNHNAKLHNTENAAQSKWPAALVAKLELLALFKR
jgi:hypothetical protein